MQFLFSDRFTKNGLTYQWVYVYIKKRLPVFIGRIARFDGHLHYQSLRQFRTDRFQWFNSSRTRCQVAEKLWREYEEKGA